MAILVLLGVRGGLLDQSNNVDQALVEAMQALITNLRHDGKEVKVCLYMTDYSGMPWGDTRESQFKAIKKLIDNLSGQGITIADVIVSGDIFLHDNPDLCTEFSLPIKPEEKAAGNIWRYIGLPVAVNQEDKKDLNAKRKSQLLTAFNQIESSKTMPQWDDSTSLTTPEPLLIDYLQHSPDCDEVIIYHQSDFDFQRVALAIREASSNPEAPITGRYCETRAGVKHREDYLSDKLIDLKVALPVPNNSRANSLRRSLAPDSITKAQPCLTKAELIQRLHAEADRIDGGRTISGYMLGIATLGIYNRFVGNIQKASRLRALAYAIASDYRYDSEPDPVNSYINTEYGKEYLQRRGAIFPFHYVDENISVKSVAKTHRHGWIDWLFDYKDEATNTEKRLGLGRGKH